MLSIRPQKLLGMLIEPNAIQLAEIITGRTPRVVQHHRFEFEPGSTWDKPGEIGVKLAAFLRQHKYSAKQVVIGLPGQWTMLKARTLPPCNPTSAAAMLRLAIEREYHETARDWSFDYHLQSSDNKEAKVLLAAAPRKKLNQTKQMATAAGLTVVATLPATLTLADEQPKEGDNAAIYLSDNSNELVIWKQGRLIAIDRMVTPPNSASAFTGELKRMLSVHSISPTFLAVHDATSNSTGHDLDQWQRGISLPFVAIDPKQKALEPAAMLAQRWAKAPASCIDFDHSRVQAVAPSRFGRVHAMAACVVLVVLLAAGYFAVDWYMQWRAVNDLQAQLAGMKSQLVVARGSIDRLTHARGWYDNRPEMLNGVRALTLAFPTNGKVWTTSLIIRDDLTGTLAAKAEDEKAAISLIENLRATSGFTDVKMLYLRQADRTSRTVSFALNFSYTGKD